MTGPRQSPKALLLALWTGLWLVAAAPASDWISALQARLERLDEVLSAPRAADIEQVDLFGEPFRLRDLRGRIVLLSFLDRDSATEAVTWLERQTTWLLHQEDVSFVNVFYPGGMFFLIPRGEAVHRIRREVRRAEEELSAGLPEEEVERLQEADVRWIVDWRRGISSHYPVERGRVNLFLLDERGRIREVARYDPELPRDGLRARVEELLESRIPEAGRAEDL